MSDLDGQDEMFPGAGAPANISDARILHSLSAFARDFNRAFGGVRRETLMERCIAAGVEPVRTVGNATHYELADVLRAWFSAPTSGVDPDLMTPYNRLAHFRAEHEKMRLQVERAELIPWIESEQETARVLKIIHERDETLVDTIERDCGAPPAILAKIQQVVDKSREDLYAALIEEDENDTARPGSRAIAAQTTPEVGKPTPAKSQNVTPAGGGALEAASEYLLRALGAGPRLAAELIAEAAARHISESSIRRAKAKLARIEARRAGKGWEWALVDAQGAQGSQSA